MDKEQDLLEELRAKAASIVESKEQIVTTPTEEEVSEEVVVENEVTTEEKIADFDIASVFEGEDLTEEFKIKVTALFESAVAQKVSVIEEAYAQAVEEMKADLEQQAISESEEQMESIVNRVDGYLDYMVEQWIESNELALDRGIKADLYESFMHGMKNLFTEHMINVPEEKIDVLEEQYAKIEELEGTVDGIMSENVELKQTLKTLVKIEQIREAADGLSDLDAEKFFQLAEDLSYENDEVFGKKLTVIREQFFSNVDTSKELVESVQSVVTDEPIVEETQVKQITEVVNPGIAALAARLTRQY